MTDKTDKGVVVIYEEPPQKCEFCGKIKETRPYGKDGKEICFDCAMTTPEAKEQAERTFKELLK